MAKEAPASESRARRSCRPEFQPPAGMARMETLIGSFCRPRHPRLSVGVSSAEAFVSCVCCYTQLRRTVFVCRPELTLGSDASGRAIGGVTAEIFLFSPRDKPNAARCRDSASWKWLLRTQVGDRYEVRSAKYISNSHRLWAVAYSSTVERNETVSAAESPKNFSPSRPRIGSTLGQCVYCANRRGDLPRIHPCLGGTMRPHCSPPKDRYLSTKYEVLRAPYTAVGQTDQVNKERPRQAANQEALAHPSRFQRTEASFFFSRLSCCLASCRRPATPVVSQHRHGWHEPLTVIPSPITSPPYCVSATGLKRIPTCISSFASTTHSPTRRRLVAGAQAQTILFSHPDRLGRRRVEERRLVHVSPVQRSIAIGHCYFTYHLRVYTTVTLRSPWPAWRATTMSPLCRRTFDPSTSRSRRILHKN